MIKIIYGQSAKGHSYAAFYLKHNLIGLTKEELKQKLLTMVDDIEVEEEDKSTATRLLAIMENEKVASLMQEADFVGQIDASSVEQIIKLNAVTRHEKANSKKRT